jgi:hypothetical protein
MKRIQEWGEEESKREKCDRKGKKDKRSWKVKGKIYARGTKLQAKKKRCTASN